MTLNYFKKNKTLNFFCYIDGFYLAYSIYITIQDALSNTRFRGWNPSWRHVTEAREWHCIQGASCCFGLLGGCLRVCSKWILCQVGSQGLQLLNLFCFISNTGNQERCLCGLNCYSTFVWVCADMVVL